MNHNQRWKNCCLMFYAIHFQKRFFNKVLNQLVRLLVPSMTSCCKNPRNLRHFIKSNRYLQPYHNQEIYLIMKKTKNTLITSISQELTKLLLCNGYHSCTILHQLAFIHFFPTASFQAMAIFCALFSTG